MSKRDHSPFLPGDVVWHKAGGDEPVRGIVVKIGYVLVDWGPEHGMDYQDPTVLTDTRPPSWQE